MSLAVLNDVYAEVRRLAIAGSVVAPGDFRLKRLIDPLRKAGEKAPVFARVADQIEQVVHSTEQNAAAALLELGMLVGSILYTQGTTGAEGDLEELPQPAFDVRQTQISARVLKPLIEALTSTGSGRLEQIISAHERNLFCDLRLVAPALKALDDSYSEIRDYVAGNILPMYGRGILDNLRLAFDMKGKASHGLRLRVMHRIAPEETRELVLRSLEKGSKDVKMVAVACLGDFESDLGYLLEQSQARNKEVRAAAILSLARLQALEAQDRLIQLLDSDDLELLFRPATEFTPRRLLAAAVEKATHQLALLLLIKDKKFQATTVQRILSLLRIAVAKFNNGVELLLIRIIDKAHLWEDIKSEPGASDLVEFAVQQLAEGSETAQSYLVAHRDSIAAKYWRYVASAGRRSLTSAEFFKTFSSYLIRDGKKRSEEAERSDALMMELKGSFRHQYHHEINASSCDELPPLDPRWLDLAIGNDLPALVFAISHLQSKSLNQYLSDCWNKIKSKKNSTDDWEVARAMVEAKHPDAQSVVLERLKSSSTPSKYGYLRNIWCDIASKLTPAAIPALEALVTDPKTSESLSDSLVEAIRTIREREKNEMG